LQEVPQVNGNEAELREVLTNLIFNAVDATPESGTITIRTYSDDEYVVLEVSDTGVGMPQDVQQRCFEPFFSTKGEDGTGLGLAMVYGIVQRHEGNIAIKSEVGKGTSFIIRLPRLTEQQRKDGAQRAEANLPSLHILVVDDEPMVLDVVIQYLTADGHTVEIATNGIEGLEKFHTGWFDLVITDRAMPDMNGIQLASLIKQVAPNKPIIMLTGFGDMMKANDDIPESIDYLVSKPVTLTEFREVLSKVSKLKIEE